LTNDEDLFAEDYGKGKKDPEPEPKDESPKPESKPEPKPEPKTEVKKEEKPPRPELIKPTVGRARVVGVSVIGVVIAVIVIMATGVIQVNIPESLITPPPTSESELANEREIAEQGSDKSPLKEVPSTSENVNVEQKTSIAKVPKKIEKAGNTKINFNCFNDEHLGTQTYFGTFKNVLDPFLKVDVFINEKQVQSKTTNAGSALIVEGSCLGNES
jgi:hypothetical protein